jgi:hypothetical protein
VRAAQSGAAVIGARSTAARHTQCFAFYNLGVMNRSAACTVVNTARVT